MNNSNFKTAIFWVVIIVVVVLFWTVVHSTKARPDAQLSFTPCRSLPLMLTDLILPAFTSFINCVNQSWASGRALVLWTTVQNKTTTTMMTTQKMAVLKFELFMPSPYTPGNTTPIWLDATAGRIDSKVRLFPRPAVPSGSLARSRTRRRPQSVWPKQCSHYR